MTPSPFYPFRKGYGMDAITSTYEKYAKWHPHKTAIRTKNDSITYQEWHRLVGQTAAWLCSLSARNKVIGIYMDGGLPFLQVFAGAAAAGWVAVPIDGRWSQSELEKRLQLCEPGMIVASAEYVELARSSFAHTVIWEEVSEAISRFAPIYQEVEGSIPFYMGFTSGSTGEPKGFIRSHHSWVASFRCTQHDFGVSETDEVLIPGALIHSHFLYGAVSTLYLGGTVYLLDKFSEVKTLDVIDSAPITLVYLVPTMIQALLREGRTVEKELTIISSGAKWEEDSKRRIREQFTSLTMYEYYGASELSYVSYLTNRDNQLKPGSVGKPCTGVQIEIRTPDRKQAAPNQIGKIYVKSDLIFLGYVTKSGVQTIKDQEGWCTVDDMGYVDDDGYLYITGREKNMILYGGINVFAEEIEAVLSQHPEVETAVVIGMKDEYWGQIITAVIKGTAAKKELRTLCKNQLAAFKIPRRWIYMDHIPLTAGGKVDRPKVIQMAEKEGAAVE
ncbi:long-chain acyl-CoA synthetase [Bacillus ectoiniformans]|uniref:AMP-binding protein n=1 Tax=Bacillus ectoiniformans TaxID=1494429 RepID=UPI001EF7DC4B|nr:AMP-binding protein [Bacillus ectoiniformans]MBM7647446.1 long-chain acyl-CoA synthetase [Bacillus ectoiniformans]